MGNKIISASFIGASGPITGLTPRIDIWELDPLVPSNNTQVVNKGALTEVGGGWYRYDFASYDPTKSSLFTIDGGNILDPCDRYQTGGNESYVEDIAPAVWDVPSIDHMVGGSTGETLQLIKSDTTSIAISEILLASMITTLLKYQRNRTRIDLPNSQLIIYDNDGVTPLTKFDLKDFNGMPNVQEVCEKVPVI